MATGRFSEEEVDIAVELVQEWLQRGEASGYHFLLLRDGERLLGYSCYGPIPAAPGRFDLYWIVVDPGLQGQGLGQRLLRSSERDAVRRGASRMYVDTSSRAEYVPTRRFYERAGYELAARLDDFYADGDAKCIYLKRLD